MRDLIITLVIFGTLPMIFRNPWVGVLSFSWISYMSPHRLTWGFAYDMPFAAVVGAVTLVSLALSKEPKKIPLNALVITWIIWIIWMNVTTLFALIPADALFEWKRSMKIQLMVLITIMLMQSPHRIKLLVWVIVLSIGFFGVKGGIFAVLSGGNFRVWGPPGSFIEGNNPLALALMMILPLLFYLYQHTLNKWLRYGIIIAMPIIGLSILSSYSRGAFLAAIAVVAYLVINSRKKVVLVPILAVLVVGGLSFMPDKYFNRINTINTYEEDGSAMGRINAWYYAFNLAKDRPVVGGGFSSFDPKLFYIYAPEPEDFHDAHSIYFEVLGEHGFVGLGIFLMLGVIALQYGRQVRKLTKERDDLKWAYDLSSMIQVSLIGYAVGGAFLGLAYFDLYYHLISLLLLTRMEVNKVIKKGSLDAEIIRDKDSEITSNETIAISSPNEKFRS